MWQPEDLKQVWAWLGQMNAEALSGPAGYLTATSAYTLAVPGKLLRPLLLLEACRAAGGDPDQVISAAAGLEAAHVASLIHDDIVDGDDLRRGQPSLHARFDLPAALITGDLFIFYSFLGLVQAHQGGVSAEEVLQAIRLLSQMGIDMAKGQALEAVLSCQPGVTETAYLHMVRLKTASACAAACHIGACLGGGSAEATAALAAFGDNLGVAFQIVDDILAYEGDLQALGKPLSSDLRNCRITLPLILAHQSASPDLRYRLDDLTVSDAPAAARHAEMKTILTETGALDAARSRALYFSRCSQEHLHLLPDSPARQRLHQLADKLYLRVT
jgi:geranylgeranyl diphosphate synthase type I